MFLKSIKSADKTLSIEGLLMLILGIHVNQGRKSLQKDVAIEYMEGCEKVCYIPNMLVN